MGQLHLICAVDFHGLRKTPFHFVQCDLHLLHHIEGGEFEAWPARQHRSRKKKVVLFWNTSIVNTRLGCNGTICLSFSFVIAVQKLPMVDIMSIYIGGEGVQNLQSRGYLSRAFMWKEAVLWTRVVQAKLKANVGAMSPFIFGSWWFESLRKRLGIQEYLMM